MKLANNSLMQLMHMSHLSLSNSTGAGEPFESVTKCGGITNVPLKTPVYFWGMLKTPAKGN